MKIIKGSLVVLALLAILLLTSYPSSAAAPNIDDHQVGENNCLPLPRFDWPHFSGPVLHLYGTYGCHVVAYDRQGNPFPMATGMIILTNARYQVLNGEEILTAILRLDTEGGGTWVGSLIWPVTGVMKLSVDGEGIFEGMHWSGYYDPMKGLYGGTILMKK